MRRNRSLRHRTSSQSPSKQRLRQQERGRRGSSRPAAAYRQRGDGNYDREAFNAPERWFEPSGRERIRVVAEPAGKGYFHPVTREQVLERISQLPKHLTRGIEVIKFSRVTRKRTIFPCYGMQWGSSVYLYPMEESLVEVYARPPRVEQIIEARMFGGVWEQKGEAWRLKWNRDTIRDFYLNNVLIHEIGHINDDRNSSFEDRERYANWFAIEYGYRVSRGRR